MNDETVFKAHKYMLKELISRDYNILMIAKEDRLTFGLISLCLTVGVGLYFLAIQNVSSINFSLVSLIIFGGVTPTVMNLRVRCWGAYQCRMPNYIDVPTKIGLIVDFSMLILVLIGTGCVFYGFGGVFKLAEVGD